MNRSQKSESISFFTRHKVSRSSSSINLSNESVSKGTEASSRDIREKDSVFHEIRGNSPLSSINILSFHRALQESSKPQAPTTKDSPQSDSKYVSQIRRLKEEIQIMNQQLESAYDQINELTFQINEINRKHSLQVQRIHENNQKKITDLQNESKLMITNSELNIKNMQLKEIIFEKEKQIKEQQNNFNMNIDYMTQQYEKKLRFRENENSFVIENLKNQFVDVIDEMKNKYFNEIQGLQQKYNQNVKHLEEALIGFDLQDEEEDKEICGMGFGVSERKVHDSLRGSEIIDELSFQQNLSLNPFEQSIEASYDFDKSLKQLISQISFHDLSMSDLVS